MTSMLVRFALLMAGLTGLAIFGLNWGWPRIEAWRLVPRVPFHQQPALPRNAYAAPAMWVARPGLTPDPAQFLPPGVRHDRKGAAYVFFLHATTYEGRRSWNAPLDHASSRRRADAVVRSTASAFNDEAGVYAPRYRQAALGTFLANRPEQLRALALAQSDARLALTAFLNSVPADAPIVFAGRGQGALILMRLIRDMVTGTPLSARVIAIYLTDWPVSARHDLPVLGVPACTHADQAGCIMTWTTFASPADPREAFAMAANYPALDGSRRNNPPVCTNPLNGGAAPDAPASANLGSLVMADERHGAALVRKSVGARCDPRNGLLIVSKPPHLGDDVMPGNNFSFYDFPLFWLNLRGDLARREATWTRAHRQA
ncbi:DUF3089 domain-containing protein [Novosphingobium sp.]|uniref:DUF3089 domain-containing protein n=1 Tax=Novosphingobium sp. TaxID=1874826 RepID=UPI003D12B8D5